ncbi:phosphoglycerate mutase-like protein [Cystobasidium minutum MCA 4210]|uniref:phosphoglycerate mutase-like protein n=1 Tax=Cystobasidium minutum MCA 4210 TaxID=1397322 RepID=UPI0034CE6D7F|eukprot:jgi/Rhomi1/33673/CE33672_9260
MSGKVIYLTRHAEAEHNVNSEYFILDAPLTAKGREQSAQLHENTQHSLQKEVELVVSSPLRRTMQTTLIGYPHAIERLGGKSKVILLPEAQECNDYPCDTGSDRAELEKDSEFEGLDLSVLTDDWNSKKGKYAANVTTLQARARHVRNFLRSRPEKSIVLVAHGDILRYIVFGEQNATPWSNAEVRKYTFVDEDGEEAWLKVLETEAKEGHEEPTSSEAKEGKA